MAKHLDLPSNDMIRSLSQRAPPKVTRGRPSMRLAPPSIRRSIHARKQTVHPANSIGNLLGGSGTEEELLVTCLKEGMTQLYSKVAVEGRSGFCDAVSFEVDGEMAQLEEYEGMLYSAVRNVFGIVEKEYEAVLCETGKGSDKTGFRHIGVGGAASKSSSWFLVVGDMRYILKTCSMEEADLMLEILPSYLLHVRNQACTLLPRFYGLYRLQIGEGSGTCFFVMNNVFAARHPVIAKFDIKGSTKGRFATEKEKAKGQMATLKDLDLLRLGRPLVFADGEDSHANIIEAVDADTSWLASHGLLDYSMMVGLGIRGDEEESLGRHIVHAESLVVLRPGDPNLMYFGIIDILTRFTCRKKVEAYLGKVLCMGDISCKRPDEYAARFRRFLRHITCSPSDTRRFMRGQELESVWRNRGDDLLMTKGPPGMHSIDGAGTKVVSVEMQNRGDGF